MKSQAIDFLQLASSGQCRQAFEKYVASNFVHHNPYYAKDAATLEAGMQANADKFTDKKLEVHRAIEEGDLVAVHSRVSLDPGGPTVAVVHIFRFEGDRIAELWDIGQVIPTDAVNEMF